MTKLCKQINNLRQTCWKCKTNFKNMLMHCIAWQSRQSCWQRSLRGCHVISDRWRGNKSSRRLHDWTLPPHPPDQQLAILWNCANQIKPGVRDPIAVLGRAFSHSYYFKVDFVEWWSKPPPPHPPATERQPPIISDSANFLCVFQRMLI